MEVVGTSKFVASGPECRWPGDPLTFWLVSEVGTVMWRTEILTCGVCTNSRRLVLELNCSVSVGAETGYLLGSSQIILKQTVSGCMWILMIHGKPRYHFSSWALAVSP